MADSDGKSDVPEKDELEQKLKTAVQRVIQEDNAPDELDIQEANALLAESDEPALREENDLLAEQVADLKVNRELRKKLSARTYRYMWGWTALVFLTLWADAMKFPRTFQLPETVLTILAGSTTVTVLGLAAIVLRGLFPKGKNK